MHTKAAAKWIDRAIIAVMAVLGFFMLLPFAWLFSMSFRSVADAYKMPPSFIPPSLDFNNYVAVLTLQRAVRADLFQLGRDRHHRHLLGS